MLDLVHPKVKGSCVSVSISILTSGNASINALLHSTAQAEFGFGVAFLISQSADMILLLNKKNPTCNVEYASI